MSARNWAPRRRRRRCGETAATPAVSSAPNDPAGPADADADYQRTTRSTPAPRRRSTRRTIRDAAGVTHETRSSSSSSHLVVVRDAARRVVRLDRRSRGDDASTVAHDSPPTRGPDDRDVASAAGPPPPPPARRRRRGPAASPAAGTTQLPRRTPPLPRVPSPRGGHRSATSCARSLASSSSSSAAAGAGASGEGPRTGSASRRGGRASGGCPGRGVLVAVPPWEFEPGNDLEDGEEEESDDERRRQQRYQTQNQPVQLMAQQLKPGAASPAAVSVGGGSSMDPKEEDAGSRTG